MSVNVNCDVSAEPATLICQMRPADVRASDVTNDESLT